jgi:hypothetical protein
VGIHKIAIAMSTMVRRCIKQYSLMKAWEAKAPLQDSVISAAAAVESMATI